MSRRCLICSNINPCREHSDAAQDAELDRNLRAIREIRADDRSTPPQDGGAKP